MHLAGQALRTQQQPGAAQHRAQRIGNHQQRAERAGGKQQGEHIGHPWAPQSVVLTDSQPQCSRYVLRRQASRHGRRPHAFTLASCWPIA
jgi:hypothetical protein